MFPRHPFLFRFTTTFALMFIIVSLFYSHEIQVHIVVQTAYQEPVTNISGLPLTFRINQKPCKEDVYLVIYIHSKPENTERRRAIRYSWGASHVMSSLNARLVFLTGIPDNKSADDLIRGENHVYKDIIQSEYRDTYRNLTYKAISGLKWLSEKCRSPKFVLKSDDDMVIDIYRLVYLMKTTISRFWGTSNLLVCHTWDHMDVVRNKSSKWYTSEIEYPDEFFPRYCSGSAFFMTSDVARNLFLKTRETPFFWIDDVYVTGMLARAHGINAISYNKKYVVSDGIDIKEALVKDRNIGEIMFVHSPNTSMSVYVWKTFLTRWKTKYKRLHSA